MQWLRNLKVGDQVYTRWIESENLGFGENLNLCEVKEIFPDSLIVSWDVSFGTQDIIFCKKTGISFDDVAWRQKELIKKNRDTDKIYDLINAKRQLVNSCRKISANITVLQNKKTIEKTNIALKNLLQEITRNNL